MSYQTINTQLSMALDEYRNRQYEIALKKVITPDSVVLDVGAGLGPFGLLAAKLGAKKVYCVEPQAVVHSINNVARDNQLSDKIVCIQGRIEDVSLPEKVDVITSCFTGNFLLSEDLLPSLFFARDHYLKPGGTMIPDSGSMFAVPVTSPKLHKSHIQKVSKQHLGIDFGYYQKQLANTFIRDRSLARKHYLAEPLHVQTLDFTSETQASCDQILDFEINRAGLCHGFLGWFDMTLLGKTLSTSSDAPNVHWSRVWFPVDPPLTLEEGDKLSITIKKTDTTKWSWILQSNGEKRVHSSMLSNVVKPNFKPPKPSPLNTNNQQLLTALIGFNNNETKQDIAQKLHRGWPKSLHLDGAADLVEQWHALYCDNVNQDDPTSS